MAQGGPNPELDHSQESTQCPSLIDSTAQYPYVYVAWNMDCLSNSNLNSAATVANHHLPFINNNAIICSFFVVVGHE